MDQRLHSQPKSLPNDLNDRSNCVYIVGRSPNSSESSYPDRQHQHNLMTERDQVSSISASNLYYESTGPTKNLEDLNRDQHVSWNATMPCRGGHSTNTFPDYPWPTSQVSGPTTYPKGCSNIHPSSSMHINRDYQSLPKELSVYDWPRQVSNNVGLLVPPASPTTSQLAFSRAHETTCMSNNICEVTQPQVTEGVLNTTQSRYTLSTENTNAILDRLSYLEKLQNQSTIVQNEIRLLQEKLKSSERYHYMNSLQYPPQINPESTANGHNTPLDRGNIVTSPPNYYSQKITPVSPRQTILLRSVDTESSREYVHNPPEDVRFSEVPVYEQSNVQFQDKETNASCADRLNSKYQTSAPIAGADSVQTRIMSRVLADDSVISTYQKHYHSGTQTKHCNSGVSSRIPSTYPDSIEHGAEKTEDSSHGLPRYTHMECVPFQSSFSTPTISNDHPTLQYHVIPPTVAHTPEWPADGPCNIPNGIPKVDPTLPCSPEKRISTADINQDVITGGTDKFLEPCKTMLTPYANQPRLPPVVGPGNEQQPPHGLALSGVGVPTSRLDGFNGFAVNDHSTFTPILPKGAVSPTQVSNLSKSNVTLTALVPSGSPRKRQPMDRETRNERRRQQRLRKKQEQQQNLDKLRMDIDSDCVSRCESEMVREVPQTKANSLETSPNNLSKKRSLTKSTKMAHKKIMSDDAASLISDSPKTDSGTSVVGTKKRRMPNRKTLSEPKDAKKVKRNSDKEDEHQSSTSFDTTAIKISPAQIVRMRPPKSKKKRPLPILIRKRKRCHFYGDDSESDPDIASCLSSIGANPAAPGKGNQDSGVSDKRRSERTAGDRKRYALDIDLNLSDDEEDESDDRATAYAANPVGPIDTEERGIIKVVESVLGRRMAKRIVKKKQTESVQKNRAKDANLRLAVDGEWDDDEQEEDVEEFYLKYKGFSYLHCEWRALDEIDDPRIRPKLRRFEMKQTNNAAQTEDDDVILFNPDYVEVERVLDMKVYRDGQLVSTNRPEQSPSTVVPAERWRTTKHQCSSDRAQFEHTPALQHDCFPATQELIETFEKCKASDAVENDKNQCTGTHSPGAGVQSRLASGTEIADGADEDKSPYGLAQASEQNTDKLDEAASKCSDDEQSMEPIASVHGSIDGWQGECEPISQVVDKVPVTRPEPDCYVLADGNHYDGTDDEKEDAGGSRTPVSITYYLVKWRSLPYEDATWELAQDVDPAKVKEFIKLRQPPNTDLVQRDCNYKVIRPDPSFWRPIKSDQVFRNNNKLRDYQLEGVNWLTYCWFHHRNCILADEMGLGKTVQSVAFLLELEKVGIRGPFIVIVPLSTVSNWQREFENWSNFNVVVYHGSTVSRNMIQTYEIFYPFGGDSGSDLGQTSPRHDVYKFHALVTTFEILMTDIEFFGQIHWAAAIIDEAHRLKNKKCKLGEGLRYLDLDHRVLLTGTPLQNNVEELFGLLNFLEPERFNCSFTFVAEYGDLKTEEQVESLKDLLKPMMLRRLKEDVEKGLAPKEETIVEVELTNIQKKYYRAIMERNFSFLCKGSTHANTPNLMNVMMELRKCCNHPFLIKGAEDAILEDMQNQQSPSQSGTEESLTFQALVYSSGKLVLIHKLLPKLRANGHKVLVFSQMIRVLDILEDYLISQRFPFERIDGRIHGPLRQEAIDRFTADPDKFVFLLCTKAGGLGINLTAADVVIIYDSDWNPQNDLQAQARCHRIGQRKMVKVYRLITRNTYEREMFDRASLKLGLDRAVLQSMGSKEARQAQMTKKEIEELLKKGAYGALMDDDKAGEDFCEEDIDKILQSRSRVVQLEQGEKNSTFSKATFSVSNNRSDIELDDPNFWQKWAKMAGVDEDDSSLKDLIMKTPRIRRQTSRYSAVSASEPTTASPASYDVSELEDSANAQSSGDDTAPVNSNNRGRFRRTRKQRRQFRSQKGGSCVTVRRDNQPSECDAAELDIPEPLDRADLFRVERCLLTWAWSHWDIGLSTVPFKRLLKPTELSYFGCAVLAFASRYMPSNADPRLKATIFELSRPGVWNRSIAEIASSVSIASRKETLRSNRVSLNLPSDHLKTDLLMTEVADSPSVGSPAVVNGVLPENNDFLSNTTGRTSLTEHDATKKVSDSLSNTTNVDDSVEPSSVETKSSDKLPSLETNDEGEAVKCCPEKSATELISPKTAGFDVDSVVSYETFQKHVQRGSTRLLNRVSFLFFLQCEVIRVDQATEFIAGRLTHSDFTELEASLPPLEAIDSELPATWWDTCCDKCLLLGVLKHGWEKYTSMRLDPSLCFWSRAKSNMNNQQASSECETPAAALDQTQPSDTDKVIDSKELPSKVELHGPSSVDTVDHPGSATDGGATFAPSSTPPKAPETDESAVYLPTGNAFKSLVEEDLEEECDEDVDDSERLRVPLCSGDTDGTTTGDPDHSLLEALPFPAVADLNNRARKLVSYFQRIKNHMDTEEFRISSQNRHSVGDDEQGLRTPLSRFVENRVVKWTRREEADFYRVVSSFGVEFTPVEQDFETQSSTESHVLRSYRWLNFRQLANVNRKSDEALTEYFHAFYRMCQKVCKRHLTEFAGPVTTASTTTTFGSCEAGSEVHIEPISEERANRCLSRIDLLTRIRNRVLPHPELNERLRLCQRSSDMPGWWVAGLHDGELLRAAAKHGLARTDFNMLSDREFSFSRIIQLIRDKLSTNSVVLDYVGDLSANQSTTSRANIAAAAAAAAQAAADEVVAKIAPHMAETPEVDRESKKDHDADQNDAKAEHLVSLDQASVGKEDLKCREETGPSNRCHDTKAEVGETPPYVCPAVAVTDQVPLNSNSVMNEWSVKFATNLATAWPKDRTVQHRLEMVCQAIEMNEWPTPRRYFPIPSAAAIPVTDPNGALNESRIMNYSSALSTVRTLSMVHDAFTSTANLLQTNSPGMSYMSQQICDKQSTACLGRRKFLDNPSSASGDHLDGHDRLSAERNESLSTDFQLPLNLASSSTSHQSFGLKLATSETLSSDFAMASSFPGSKSLSAGAPPLSPFGSTCLSTEAAGAAMAASASSSAPTTPPSSRGRGRGRARIRGGARGGATGNPSRGLRSVDSGGGRRQATSPQSSVSGGSDSSHGNKMPTGDTFSPSYGSARGNGSAMPPPDTSACYRPGAVGGPSRRRRNCHPRNSARDFAPVTVRLPHSKRYDIGGQSDDGGVSSPRVTRGRRSGVGSVSSNDACSSTSQEVWNVRVPVINMTDGSLIYGEKAPRRRSLEAWLEANPSYMPYSVEMEDRTIYNRVASSRGQEVNNMEVLAYRHYLGSLLSSAAAAAVSTTSASSLPSSSSLLQSKGTLAPATAAIPQQQQQYLQQQQLLATLSAYARHPAYASMISSALANWQACASSSASSSVAAVTSTTGVNLSSTAVTPPNTVSLDSSSSTTATVSSRTRAATRLPADPVPAAASTSSPANTTTSSMETALSEAYKQAGSSLAAYMYNPLMAAAAYSQMMLAAAAAAPSTPQAVSPSVTPAVNVSIQNQYHQQQQQQAILASLYANYLSLIASASLPKPNVFPGGSTTTTTATTAPAPSIAASLAWEPQRQQMASFAAALAAACGGGGSGSVDASANSLAAALLASASVQASSSQQQPQSTVSCLSRDDTALSSSPARAQSPKTGQALAAQNSSPRDAEAVMPSGGGGGDSTNPNDQSHCILDLSK